MKRGASVARREARKPRESSQAGILVCRFDDPDSYPFDEPDFDPDQPEELETILAAQRDSFADLAKSELVKLFEEQPESVFL